MDIENRARAGQPVCTYRLPVCPDLGDILAQPRLVAGHLHLGAGPAQLVAGTPADRPAGAMLVSVKTADPDPVAHPLRHRNHLHDVASDDRGCLAGEAGRVRRPIDVGGQRHGEEDTAGRRKGCDKGAGSRREHVRRRGADAPPTRDKVQFFR